MNYDFKKSNYKVLFVEGGNIEKSPAFNGNIRLGKTPQSVKEVSLNTTKP